LKTKQHTTEWSNLKTYIINDDDIEMKIWKLAPLQSKMIILQMVKNHNSIALKASIQIGTKKKMGVELYNIKSSI
jgi:phage terminase large subunit GpA-like protein